MKKNERGKLQNKRRLREAAVGKDMRKIKKNCKVKNKAKKVCEKERERERSGSEEV